MEFFDVKRTWLTNLYGICQKNVNKAILYGVMDLGWHARHGAADLA